MQTVTKAQLYPTRIDLAQNIRAQIVELLNTDLYIEISRTVDKYLWFLEAHLQDK